MWVQRGGLATVTILKMVCVAVYGRDSSYLTEDKKRSTLMVCTTHMDRNAELLLPVFIHQTVLLL